MILRLYNEMLDISISNERPSILYIDDCETYVSLIRSLEDEHNIKSRVPYGLISDKDELIKKKGKFNLVTDPIHYPNVTTTVKKKLYKKVSSSLRELVDKGNVEKNALEITDTIVDVSLEFWGEYCFCEEWDLEKYLKTFKFEPEIKDTYSVLDVQLAWLGFLADIDAYEPVIYANLLKNIDEKSFEILVEQAKFLQIPLILIESGKCSKFFDNMNSYIVDHDFYVFKNPD